MWTICKIRSGKKELAFNSTTKRLLSALGGDASNPTCRRQPFELTQSSNTTATFTQDTLATLLKCEADIAEKCGNPLTGNTSKLAELDSCGTLANKFLLPLRLRIMCLSVSGGRMTAPKRMNFSKRSKGGGDHFQ